MTGYMCVCVCTHNHLLRQILLYPIVIVYLPPKQLRKIQIAIRNQLAYNTFTNRRTSNAPSLDWHNHARGRYTWAPLSTNIDTHLRTNYKTRAKITTACLDTKLWTMEESDLQKYNWTTPSAAVEPIEKH